MEAQAALGVIESLLDSAALLDPRSLAAGNWVFVSFPAYLMARSLAETLANPGQRFFHDDYWEQGPHRPEEDVEEQRTILRYLELQRARSAPQGEARPIRFVHVSWGLIKLEDRFLMHHREDKHRSEARNYVFPGGRLNLSDLPPALRGPEILPELFRGDSPLAAEYLPRTLERELHEELKLVVGEDYRHAPFLTLPPFRQVEGARNNHALTEYGIQIFHIRLTPKGEATLHDRVCSEPGRFSWFGIGDLARQQLPDGRSAYIDALTTALKGKLQATLEKAPESSSYQPRYAGENQLVTVPVAPDRPFLIGKTGKENSIQLPMTQAQWELLFALAWHCKGLEFKPASREMVFLPNGWVRLNDARQMAEARQFAAALAAAGQPLLEITADVYLRVSVDKGSLFFDDALFSYSLDRAGDGEGVLEIFTRAIAFPWGVAQPAKVPLTVTRNVCRIIAAIQQGKDPDSEPNIMGSDWERNLREKIDACTRLIGLRKFIRTESKRNVIAPAWVQP